MKKKILSLVISASLGIAGSIGSVSAAEGIMYGDVDGNKTVDLSDLSALSLVLIGENEADEEQQKTGDLNADGVLDLSDLAMLKRYVGGCSVRLGNDEEYSSVDCVRVYNFICRRGLTSDEYVYDNYFASGQLVDSFEEYTELIDKYDGEIFKETGDDYFKNNRYSLYTDASYDENFFEDNMLFFIFSEVAYGMEIQECDVDINNEKITVTSEIHYDPLAYPSDFQISYTAVIAIEIPKSLYNGQDFEYQAHSEWYG
jgi:hypothetical protein